MQQHDLDRERIRSALNAVGELLAAEGEHVAIIVAGGASLNLLGIVRRTTTDVDVLARAERRGDGVDLREAEPLPPALVTAIRTVARDFGLGEQWMNADVGQQLSQGLPPGLTAGLTWKTFGGALDVGLVGRQTLISLKLFAAADQGPRSVHMQDLLRLEPTNAEFANAKAWVETQDAAAEWPGIVEEVIRRVETSH